MKSDVAILIVTHQSEGHIEACLRSVYGQRRSVSQQVILLDNGSSDRTVEIVRSRFPGVKILIPGRNLGFAAGVNAAARHAEAEFLLLLNPDTLLLEHAVDRIVAFARAHPSHGFYGGRTLTSRGELEPSCCWGAPTPWSLAMFATGLSTLARRHPLFDPESLGNWKRDSVREVGVITGCFLLASRHAWDRLGGFDERYFMYGEDADLAIRARAAGFRPVLCPGATLIHDVGQSSATPLDKAKLLYRGKATLVLTRWDGLAKVAGIGCLLAGVGLRALLEHLASLRRPGRPRSWIGLWQDRKHWIRGYAPPASKPAYDMAFLHKPAPDQSP